MIIAESGQADRKKERHIDWFSFKKTILRTKNKKQSHVICNIQDDSYLQA